MDRDANLNKLVRLTTLDRNAIFDAQFDEEVLIPPQTEIALKSASVAFTGAQEVLTPDNNGCLVTVFHDNTQRDIDVLPGSFNVNNIDNLFDDMTSKINGSIVLGENVNETGLEYLVGFNQAQRCEIQSIYAHYISPTGTGTYEFGKGTPRQAQFWKTRGGVATQESIASLNDGVITRAATAGLTTAPDYRGTVFSDFSFTGGAGVWRSVIEQLRAPLGAGSVSGFCIGFTSNRNALLTSTMTDNDVVCGIRIQADNAGGVGNFEFKASANTAFTDTGITTGAVAVPGGFNPATDPENRPCIEWRSTKENVTNQHVIQCFLHRNGQASVSLGQSARKGDLASNKDLVGFYAFYAGTTFNDITAVNYCPSFFNTPAGEETMERIKGFNSTHTTLGILRDSDLPGIIASRGVDLNVDMRFRMVIPNPVLKQRIMGFDSGKLADSLPAGTLYDITAPDLLFPVSSAPVGDIRGDLPFINVRGAVQGVVSPQASFAIFGSQNYLVELLNLPLNSYDSFPAKRGRANILAVIPVNEHESGNIDNVLMYEPNEMTYISLTNKSELSLRNIRARVIFPDYSLIETVGLTTLVLHLRPVK